MVPQVELYLFVFWENWRHQKDISKLNDLYKWPGLEEIMISFELKEWHSKTDEFVFSSSTFYVKSNFVNLIFFLLKKLD